MTFCRADNASVFVRSSAVVALSTDGLDGFVERRGQANHVRDGFCPVGVWRLRIVCLLTTKTPTESAWE